MTVRRAIEFTPADLALNLTSCFEGYLHPFVLDAPGFERRFRPEALDSEASLLMFEGEAPVGLCLIARRGWTCRCAAMAVAPPFRRQGVGERLMRQAVQEARDRGDKRFVLEVIEQNPAAIELYRKVGLEVRRRLVGHVRRGGPTSDRALAEIDPLAVSRLMVANFPLDVPWDYTPENLSSKSSPTKGLTLDGKSFALVTDTPGPRVVLWSVFTTHEFRLQGLARELVWALAGLYPGKELVTPIAWPDDLAKGFFIKAGFEEAKISQFEMTIEEL